MNSYPRSFRHINVLLERKQLNLFGRPNISLLVSSTVSLFIAMTIMVVGKDLREKHDIKFDEPAMDTVQVNLEE